MLGAPVADFEIPHDDHRLIGEWSFEHWHKHRNMAKAIAHALTRYFLHRILLRVQLLAIMRARAEQWPTYDVGYELQLMYGEGKTCR